MDKILVLTLISSISFLFLIFQAIVLNFLEGDEQLFSGNYNLLQGKISLQLSVRQEKEARDKARERLGKLEVLINASSSLEIPLILIDRGVLADLVGDLKKPIKDMVHMTSCDHFCQRRGISFGINIKKSGDLHNLEKLIRYAETQGFNSFVVSQPDMRKQTLETIKKLPRVKTFVFFKWKGLLLETVIFRPFMEKTWHAKLDTKQLKVWSPWKNTYVRQSILDNPYTRASHVFDEISPVAFRLDDIHIQVPQFMKTFVDNFNTSEFIACSYPNARTFISKYGYESTGEAALFREKARNLLSLVHSVLDTMDIPFWLSSGTCLGWFRQCDFITHSKDVDIGIRISDFNPNIAEELQNNGLKPKHVFGRIDDSYELSFQSLDKDLKLDIFFFYEEKGYMWNGGTQAKTGKKFKYKFPRFNLCWTSFVGLLVRVPCPPLPYIQANYGFQWNTLVKDWDWKKSPANVVENGEWPKEEWDKVIQVFQ